MKKNSKNKLEITHRAHLLFTGRVHGVGFRYTAEQIALGVGLVGWVKNIPDNQVEVVCEGAKDKIELFVKKVKESSLGPNIQKFSCEWEKPTLKFKDFTIEYYY